ncbi:protoporphyrinogen/coproporphyrinogen oxidase [Cuniculiplasma sp. SKW3]|uniref:protoporphyrinogen/coproporphyrinogen oxidase n=1 Tax=unclassified Cuniculiplasma TaxID=2619706 RepID=UPI003FD5AAC2
MYDEVVLGGGWAGLLYTNEVLDRHNYKMAILERSNYKEKGGLLKSEIVNGFTFDIGGPHILFSKDEKVLSNILKLIGDNVSKRERNNYVLFKGKFIPYPFENGIFKLNPEIRVQFARGIIEQMLFMSKNIEWKPKNLLEWINGFFGESMANEYLKPYNEKIWKRPLESIAADWVFTPGRLPFPELENVLKSVAGIPNVGYKEQSFFYYPKEGGIQSLYNSLYEQVTQKGAEFIGGENIIKIRKINNIYEINDKINAKKIVSTIPLPELLLCLNDSKENAKLADSFDYNSVVIVGVAISSKTPNQTTVYVPDPKIIFHRYTWMSSLISSNEDSKSNLIAEVTLPKQEAFDINKITSKVIKDLLDLHVIENEKNIIFSRTWFNKYGYPIYNIGHEDVRKKAMEILREHGIKSVGRWGSWQYWNTDMVYKAVINLLEEGISNE